MKLHRFREEAKAMKKRRGLSYRAVAMRAGLSRETTRRFFTGAVNSNMNTIRVMSRFFNLPLPEIGATPIEVARNNKCLSVYASSIDHDISVPVIVNWERGEGLSLVRKFAKYSNALGLSVEEALQLKDARSVDVDNTGSVG